VVGGRSPQGRRPDVDAGVRERALDLDAIHDATRRVTEGVAHARPVVWPDVAHLPSMEHPDDFLHLLLDWLRDNDGTSAPSRR